MRTIDLGVFSRSFMVFFSSMIPFIENKGSVLVGVALHMKWYLNAFVSSVGSFVPIPFLLGGGKRMVAAMRRYPLFDRFVKKVEGFAQEHQDFFRRNIYLSLALIISLPFTGIGIWLGCVLASILGLDKKNSMAALACGVVLSTFFTMGGAYGLFVGLRALLGSLF